MLFSSYLTLALPMASVVCGELTESLSRSRVARGLQHQELPRKAVSVSNLHPLILNNITVVSTTNKTHTLSFGVADSNTNTSTTCSSTWTESTDIFNSCSSSYIKCATSNTSFEHWQWCFKGYTNFYNFILNIDHTYTDNDVGKYPYNQLSTFSHASANLNCKTDSISGLKTPCNLNTQDGTVVAPIESLSA